jgi:hypothetical protein
MTPALWAVEAACLLAVLYCTLRWLFPRSRALAIAGRVPGYAFAITIGALAGGIFAVTVAAFSPVLLALWVIFRPRRKRDGISRKDWERFYEEYGSLVMDLHRSAEREQEP